MDFYTLRQSRGESADQETEELAARVIAAAIEVHSTLHAGLPESVYQRAMEIELSLRGIAFVPQAEVPVTYKGQKVGTGFCDLLVGAKLVVEFKSVDRLTDVHTAQVIAYLSALNLRLGLLINFNAPVLKGSIKRVVRDPVG